MTDIKVGEILFYLVGNDTVILKFTTDVYKGQGLIHFDKDMVESKYCLYKWYDEGKFLKTFDVGTDIGNHHRLKVMGVDEI